MSKAKKQEKTLQKEISAQGGFLGQPTAGPLRPLGAQSRRRARPALSPRPLPPPPPAPPTTLAVSPARARARADTGCQTLHHPRPPRLPSPAPVRSLSPSARARMTHPPPPRSLVTQSHFRVRSALDPPAGGREGAGPRGAPEWRMCGRGGAHAGVPLSNWWKVRARPLGGGAGGL